MKFSKHILSLDSPFSMLSCFNAIRDNEYPIDFNKLPKMVIYDGARPNENLSARAQELLRELHVVQHLNHLKTSQIIS